MLKQRILTALVLLPLMLGMLFYAPQWLWAAFSGVRPRQAAYNRERTRTNVPPE